MSGRHTCNRHGQPRVGQSSVRSFLPNRYKAFVTFLWLKQFDVSGERTKGESMAISLEPFARCRERTVGHYCFGGGYAVGI